MYSSVLLPLQLGTTYHYNVPPEYQEEIEIGMRCVVQFGSKRIYVGIIASLDETLPQGVDSTKLKSILYLPDRSPIVCEEEIASWSWGAFYYMATMGDFVRAAIPPILLPESKTEVYIDFDKADLTSSLSRSENELLETLRVQHKQKFLFDQLLTYIPGRNKLVLFDRLVQYGIFTSKEQVRGVNKHIGEWYLHFSKPYQNEATLEELIQAYKKRPARLSLLYDLITLQTSSKKEADLVPERTLVGDNPNKKHLLSLLLKEGILERVLQQPQPTHTGSIAYSLVSLPSLEVDRPNYYAATHLEDELHCIGHYAAQVLSSGGRVLLLLPQSKGVEGDPQVLCRLLGLPRETPLFLYTGDLTDRERASLRYRLLEGDEPLLLVGNRMAGLLPLRGVELVIIAEEQDSLYKQKDSTPRFNARDYLIYRATKIKIPLLLTSITPSVEAFYNVEQGKFLAEYSSESSPRASIKVVDLAYEYATKRQRFASLLSIPLQQAISNTLRKGKKVLVLSSRRGYAPYLLCKRCGNSIRCPQCDVSLTYHQSGNTLNCHYCGTHQDSPSACPHCGAPKEVLQKIGYGSERIEECLTECYPQEKIIRIDADTTNAKSKRKNIYQEIKRGDASLYVGTQMLSNILSIREVGLVAVPQLDQMLAIPDFRTDEFVFSLLYRLSVQYPDSQMILQTKDPERPLIQLLLQSNNHSRNEYIRSLLLERSVFGFPPYKRLINIIIKSKEEKDAVSVATHFLLLLKNHSMLADVLGPIKPYVSYVRLWNIRHLTLKIDPHYSTSQVRTVLLQMQRQLEATSIEARRSHILYDIDPL